MISLVSLVIDSIFKAEVLNDSQNHKLIGKHGPGNQRGKSTGEPVYGNREPMMPKNTVIPITELYDYIMARNAEKDGFKSEFEVWYCI